MKKKIFILVVFLFSLFVLVGCAAGEQGPQGLQGVAGKDGANGLSAYEIAKKLDPEIGTEEEWIESLQGSNGRNGKNGENGLTPYVGENGNWFIGEEDTEVQARATDPKEITIFTEDGGVYWGYVDEEDVTLLYYYLDYVTVSYAYYNVATYEEVLEDLSTLKAPTSKWSNTDADAFFKAHPEYDWLLRYFAIANPNMAALVEHYLASGKVLAGLGQYIVRTDGSSPIDAEADYALSLELAAFIAGSEDDNVWSGTWHSGNYDAETADGAANLALLAKMNYDLVYSEQVKRDKLATYEPISVKHADGESDALTAARNAIATKLGKEYGFKAWATEDDDVVTKGISNHSQTLFMVSYKKVFVDLDFNGAYILDQDKVDAFFTAEKVAELYEEKRAALEADYATYRELEVAALSYGSYSLSGNLDIAAFFASEGMATKWAGMMQFFADAVKAGYAPGTSVKANFDLTSDSGDKGYANYYTVGSFLAKKQLRADSGSWAGFNKDADGVMALFVKDALADLVETIEGAVVTSLEEVDVEGEFPSVSRAGYKLAGWYLEGDATKELLQPKDMEDGKSYVAHWDVPVTLKATTVTWADIAAVIGADFLADFNAYRKTVDANATDIASFGDDLFLAGKTGARNTQTTDISNTPIYKFFNTDAYKAKWSWILDYFLAEGSGASTHAKRQSNAVKGNGTLQDDKGTDYVLYDAEHLLCHIISMFKDAQYDQYYSGLGMSVAVRTKLVNLWLTSLSTYAVTPAEHTYTNVYYAADGCEFYYVGAGLELSKFYKEGDDTKAAVAPVNFEKGETYVAVFAKNAVDQLLEEFLADVNASAKANGFITEDVTAAQFYAKFAYILVGTGTSRDDWNKDGEGILQKDAALLAKWGWLIELSHTGNLDNKRVLAVCQKVNLEYAYSGSSEPSLDGYGAQMFTNNIHNLLNYSGESLHSGSHSSYPASDWSDVAAARAAILAAKAAAEAAAAQTPAE